MRAAVTFARTEGIIPAPESSHAIAIAIREAVKAREEGKERVILFNLSGHGLMDLNGYADFLDGKLENHSLSEADLTGQPVLPGGTAQARGTSGCRQETLAEKMTEGRKEQGHASAPFAPVRASLCGSLLPGFKEPKGGRAGRPGPAWERGGCRSPRAST